MEKQLCPFGQFFRTMREQQGVSLWRLSVGLPYPQGNIQRIERGLHEPRIELALRLITALGLNAGGVLDDLARQEGWIGEESGVQPYSVAHAKRGSPDEALADACLLGPLLRERRLLYGKSQKCVAEYADYSVRNLINVEKGTQEPGVIIALKLVIATGDSPRTFFDLLQQQIQEREAKTLNGDCLKGSQSGNRHQ